MKEEQRSPSSPATGDRRTAFDCSLPDFNKTYISVGGWTKHMQNCHPPMKLISASEATILAPQLSQESFASNQGTSTGERCYDVQSAVMGALIKINELSLCEAPIFVGHSKANARAAKSYWRCLSA